MSWVKEALEGLRSGNAVQVRPQGGSMRGRIESGRKRAPQPVLLRPVGCGVSKIFFNPVSGGEDESWPGFGEAGVVAAAIAGF